MKQNENSVDLVTTICTSLERPIPVSDESKQWHERPAIVKSNLKSILVFVKHSPYSRSYAAYEET